jgi:hypothetical protein
MWLYYLMMLLNLSCRLLNHPLPGSFNYTPFCLYANTPKSGPGQARGKRQEAKPRGRGRRQRGGAERQEANLPGRPGRIKKKPGKVKMKFTRKITPRIQTETRPKLTIFVRTWPSGPFPRTWIYRAKPEAAKQHTVLNFALPWGASLPTERPESGPN